MKKYILLCSFILCASSYAQQPSWEWNNPQPTGNTLNAVAFSDSATAWTCGALGTVLQSTDSGSTWQIRNSYLSATLRDVQFISPERGWIVGDSTIILSTTNAGKFWIRQNIGLITPDTLYKVHFVDENYGWACGVKAAIIHTTDGGTTWIQQTTPAAVAGTAFRALDFVDRNNGWAAGGNGTIIATTDGGATWKPQTTDISNTIYGIDFVNSLKGFFAGSSGILMKTTNGGTTWIEQTSGVSSILYSISMVDSLHGYAAGASSKIIYTSNGGEVWTEQPLSNGSTSTTFNALGVVSVQRAVAVGLSGAFFRTTDAGDAWDPYTVNVAPSKILYSIFFVDSMYGWVSGGTSAGFMINTTNGGASWGEQTIAATSSVYAVQFLSRTNGWACGPSGAVYNSVNGGATWTPVTVPGINEGSTVSAFDIQFINDQTGWIVGPGINISIAIAINSIIGGDNVAGPGVMVTKTTDAGATWIPETLPSIEAPEAFYAFDLQSAWIAADSGVTYRTTNGGILWSKVTANLGTKVLYDIYFINKDTGWVVGATGSIAKSTDGGVTWASKTSGVTSTLRSVHFINKNVGWASGTTGTIIYTSDGGTTWTRQPAPTIAHLYAFFPLNAKKAFAAGTGGVILTTTHSGIPFIEQKIGEAQLSRSVIDYGVRENKSVNDTTFIIKNVGNGALKVTSAAFSAGTFHSVLSGGAPFTLAPGASHQFTIRYQPTSDGLHRDTLLITSDGNVPVVTVIVLGRDSTIKIGDAQVSATLVEYGKRKVGSQNDTTVYLTNVGNGILNVTQTNFVTGTNFSIVSGGALFSLAPSATRPLVIRFSPTSVKQYDDTLVVTSDGVVQTKKIIFTGQGDSVGNIRVWDHDHTKNNFSVATYPNPFSGATTFSIEGAREDSKGVMKIFDMLGEELVARSFYGNSFTLDAGGFTTGVYLCRIQVDDVFFSHAITVIR